MPVTGPVAVERRPIEVDDHLAAELLAFEREQDIARKAAEIAAVERDERDAWVAMTIAEAPVEVTGEWHSPEEVADARATHNAMASGLVQVEYELDQLQARQRAEQRAHGSAATRPTHAPVVRARIVARPRERREHRTSARSSRAAPDDSDSDSDPPAVGGPLTAARRRAA